MSKKTRNVLLVILAILFLLFLGVSIYGFLGDEINAIFSGYKIGDPHGHSEFAGILYIPSIEIELPCIQATATDYNLVELAVNSYDCGAKLWYSLPSVNNTDSGTWLILDHNWQGFSAIMECRVGDTAFFTDAEGKEYQYIVKDKFEGYINENSLLVNSTGDQFLQSTPTNMVLMTCYPEADVTAAEADRRYYVYMELVEE